MSRYVINDFLWGDPDDVREGEGGGEQVLFLPILDDQQLNLNDMVDPFIEKMWGAEFIASEACADAIRAWAIANRKFVQPRLNKIEWDHKLGGVPGKPNFGVYLYVEDKCFDGFYGSGESEDGTDIFRNDDRDEITILTVHYRHGETIEVHRARALFVLDALNAAEAIREAGAGEFKGEYDEEDGRVSLYRTL